MDFHQVCARVRFYTMIINSIRGWNEVKAKAMRLYREFVNSLDPELRRMVFEWNEARSRFKARFTDMDS
jgi:hypothetical protein